MFSFALTASALIGPIQFTAALVRLTDRQLPAFALEGGDVSAAFSSPDLAFTAERQIGLFSQGPTFAGAA